MEYLYGKNHIKNIKKNHQEKYNLIFNQIIFSSNIHKKSKVLVMGFPDNVLVKDLINRGYNNVFYSEKYDEIRSFSNLKNKRVIDTIDYDIVKNKGGSLVYDLLIINTDYDISKIECRFDGLLKLLKKNATLIMTFSAYVKAYSPVWSSIRNIYKSSVPMLFDGNIMSLEEQMDNLNSMINSRKELLTIKSQEYNWIEEYTINEYLNLVECTECYKSMDSRNQNQISSMLHQSIDANGGSLKKANKMRVISCNKI